MSDGGSVEAAGGEVSERSSFVSRGSSCSGSRSALFLVRLKVRQ